LLPTNAYIALPRATPEGSEQHEAEIVLLDAFTRPARLEFDDLLARVRAIQTEVARLPVFDSRSPDEILWYNERGDFN
jgi:hypothetical protein